MEQRIKNDVSEGLAFKTRQLAFHFFEFLGDHSIDYAVLGDVTQYDTELRGDVDIVLPSSLSGTIPALVHRFCESAGCSIVQYLRHEQVGWYFVIARQSEEWDPQFLAIDFCTDYFRFGTLFLSSDELLGGRRKQESNVFVPAPAKAFLYYLIKKIDKGLLDDNHRMYLRHTWKLDPDGARVEMKRFWREPMVELFQKALLANDWADVESRMKEYRIALHLNVRFSLRNWVREVSRKLERVLRPTGLVVAFIGPDGAGKSSVITAIEQKLAPAFRRTFRYHLRPNFGKHIDSPPVMNPHGQEPRNVFMSIAKLLYWWSDYTIGYMIDVYIRKVRSTLVLFDRYYHDILVDPTRYRFAKPRWLAKLISRLVPMPDVVIILDAAAEILLRRKREVEHKELQRQRIVYSKCVQLFRNAHVIDVSRPLDEVVAETDKIILDYLHQRTMKRLRFDTFS